MNRNDKIILIISWALTIILLLLVLTPRPAKAESWSFEEDKKAHATVGGIISLANPILHLTDLGRTARVSVPMGLSVFAASAKEALDSGQVGNRWSWADWGYTVGSTALAVTLWETVLPNKDNPRQNSKPGLTLVAPTYDGQTTSLTLAGRF